MSDPAERRPIFELLHLAAPTVAQMASYTIMQFIDTWMLSHLGTLPPTAAANSGMMALSALGFGMGIVWIVNTLVSQSFGRHDDAQCGSFLWQGIWLSLAYSILLIPIMSLARPMFLAFGHSPAEADLEAIYFQIVLIAAMVKLSSTALGQFMLAINRPAPVLISAAFGVGVNALAAWMLVLGGLGVRGRGIQGAAWAQNIGVVCELVLLIAFAFRREIRQRFNILNFRPRWPQMKILARIGIPSGGQFIADILAWSLFCNVVIGVMGEAAMSANTFMMRYMVVSFMPAIGFSTAVTALVGRYIGMGRPDIARRRTHLAFAVTATYMSACGAVFFIFRHKLIAVFTHDEAVLSIGALYLTYAAVYQFFDAMYIVYNGALRGAGDTLVPAIATGGLCWGITVLGGFLVAHHLPRWGYGGPWTVATGYGIILGIFMLHRFLRGRWQDIHLLPPSPPVSNVPADSANMN